MNTNKIIILSPTSYFAPRIHVRLLKGNCQYKFVNITTCLNGKEFKPLLQLENALSEALFNEFNKRLNYSLL